MATKRLVDRRRILRPQRLGRLPQRLPVAVGAIAVALVAGAITGGRWRWILGGGAALTSLLALVPSLSWLIKPVAAYAGTWLGFNLMRARADDTGWAERTLGLVPRLEERLFADRLPSAVLQEQFYHPPPLAWYDYGWTAVYLSFFAAPYLAAAVLLWRNRQLFRRYLLATAGLFALALLGFFALPTAPPWLVTEAVPEAGFGQVRRVTEEVLATLDLPFRLYNSGQGDGVWVSEVRFEPNPIAAMPSIHFAATVLLVFPARRGGGLVGGAALPYAALMGAALVYLGEHYVIDLVVGGLLAAFGWAVAGWCLGTGGNDTAESRGSAENA